MLLTYSRYKELMEQFTTTYTLNYIKNGIAWFVEIGNDLGTLDVPQLIVSQLGETFIINSTTEYLKLIELPNSNIAEITIKNPECILTMNCEYTIEGLMFSDIKIIKAFN